MVYKFLGKGVYVMAILKRILGIFTGIMCITGFVMAVSQKESIVFIIEGLIFGILTFFLFKPTEKEKEKQSEKQKRQNERMKTCSMKHVNGLPIAENVNCTITSFPDSFEFSSGSMKFKLEKNKITDICIKTDEEIQQQYVSSVGGAVGGAVLFGPLGAMIGGRAKKKTIKEISHYLIITYMSDDEIKYMGFDIGLNMVFAKKVVKDFNTYSSETSIVL